MGLCTLSVAICYADRSNISTAVLPMATELGWDKVRGPGGRGGGMTMELAWDMAWGRGGRGAGGRGGEEGRGRVERWARTRWERGER